jgi:tRNA pseudouridine38-40 synthase
MQKKKYFYILAIQYLGFRYHGWQNQPNVITVEGMFRKTIRYILKDQEAKVLASGRTDAKVSANKTYIELFTYEPIKNLEVFLGTFNFNLPSDIRILEISETDENFNIIQSPKLKTYHYYFAFGEKFHPFCASLMCHIHGTLDIKLMLKAARLFEGEKDFFSYTFQPKENTTTHSKVDHCSIEINTQLTASFFPEKSFVMIVKGEGFKRNQIRLMMGALIDLGRKKISLGDFQKTLDGKNKIVLEHIAPASGLILEDVVIFDK